MENDNLELLPQALALIKNQFETLKLAHSDLYGFLNAYRDWFNHHFANYELYLEDNWFEEKTTIEYILRSLDTLNIVILAEDEYENRRDNKGVWHLGAYIKTNWIVADPWGEIEQFISENPIPRMKE